MNRQMDGCYQLHYLSATCTRPTDQMIYDRIPIKGCCDVFTCEIRQCATIMFWVFSKLIHNRILVTLVLLLCKFGWNWLQAKVFFAQCILEYMSKKQQKKFTKIWGSGKKLACNLNMATHRHTTESVAW